MNSTKPLSIGLALALTTVVLVVSCTLLPTATPQVVVHTVEVPVTQLVPVTVTPEPTPIPTATPPVIMDEDFEGGAGDWYVGSDTSGSSQIQDGKLLLTISEPNWIWQSRHPSLDYLNSAFDLTVTMTNEGGPRDSYGGIGFRFFDENNNAEIYVNGDGFVSLGMFLDGQYIFVVPWSRPATLSREPYILRLIDSGRRATAYLNGELAFDIPFEELRPGGLSLFVGTYDTAPSTWSFDDIRVAVSAP